MEQEKTEKELFDEWVKENNVKEGITPKKIDNIRSKGSVMQDNIITNSYKPYSPLGARLFTCILAGLRQGQYDYTFSIKKIMDTMGLSNKRYTELVASVDELYNKSIPIPNRDKNIDDEVRLLDRRVYPKITGEKLNGTLSLSIARSIQPYLFELKNNFTLYEVQSFMCLMTSNSQTLYVLLSQYRGTGVLVRSFDELQKIFNTNYKTLFHFREGVLNKSLEEILKKTNIKRIKLEPVKKGRKYVGYKFMFKWDTQLELKLPNDTTENRGVDDIVNKGLNKDEKEVEKIFRRLVREYHLTQKQSYEILVRVSLKEIRQTLNIIQENNTKGEIRNMGGYTLQLFRKRFAIESI